MQSNRAPADCVANASRRVEDDSAGQAIEHPSASEAEIDAALRRRLAIKRRLDERDIYRPAA